jgi:hypothetical protein
MSNERKRFYSLNGETVVAARDIDEVLDRAEAGDFGTLSRPLDVRLVGEGVG